MTERRKFLRFPANVTVEYRICRERELDGISSVKDLSREGIGFSVSKRLDRGTLLDMKLVLPQDVEPIYLTGEVAWSGELQERGDFGYIAGVKFFKINNLDRTRLLNYAYSEWLKTSKSY